MCNASICCCKVDMESFREDSGHREISTGKIWRMQNVLQFDFLFFPIDFGKTNYRANTDIVYALIEVTKKDRHGTNRLICGKLISMWCHVFRASRVKHPSLRFTRSIERSNDGIGGCIYNGSRNRWCTLSFILLLLSTFHLFVTFLLAVIAGSFEAFLI